MANQTHVTPFGEKQLSSVKSNNLFETYKDLKQNGKSSHNHDFAFETFIQLGEKSHKRRQKDIKTVEDHGYPF